MCIFVEYWYTRMHGMAKLHRIWIKSAVIFMMNANLNSQEGSNFVSRMSVLQGVTTQSITLATVCMCVCVCVCACGVCGVCAVCLVRVCVFGVCVVCLVCVCVFLPPCVYFSWWERQRSNWMILTNVYWEGERIKQSYRRGKYEGVGVVDVQLYLYLISTLEEGEWSASRSGRFTTRRQFKLPVGYEDRWAPRVAPQVSAYS